MQAFIELLLALAALVIGIAALALVIDVRSRLSQLEAGGTQRRQWEADVWAAHEAVSNEIARMQSEMDRTQRELNELKAAAQVVPAPPLPRGRSGGLDDLREQLRASHLDPESSSEDL